MKRKTTTLWSPRGRGQKKGDVSRWKCLWNAFPLPWLQVSLRAQKTGFYPRSAVGPSDVFSASKADTQLQSPSRGTSHSHVGSAGLRPDVFPSTSYSTLTSTLDSATTVSSPLLQGRRRRLTELSDFPKITQKTTDPGFKSKGQGSLLFVFSHAPYPASLGKVTRLSRN